jgi:hypothetical protein
MVGVLAIGFICNLLTRPVHERHHHSGGTDKLPIPTVPSASTGLTTTMAVISAAGPAPAVTTSPARLAMAWTFVGIPLAWGVYQTLLKSVALFV